MTAPRALSILYVVAGVAALAAAVIEYVRRADVDWFAAIIGVLLLVMGIARWARARRAAKALP